MCIRDRGQSVYAGTVLEEGELEIIVRAVSGATRFEKIVTMIEDSEKLKSNLESKAEHLADRLVPYTLLGTGLVWAVTRNMTKALSVLMVDFSLSLIHILICESVICNEMPDDEGIQSCKALGENLD